MKRKRLLRLLALWATLSILLLILCFLRTDTPEAGLPGTEEPPRQLVRIWVTGAPGGGMKWLQSQLKAFERAYPGVSCYVRQVNADLLNTPAAAPPDLVLFMPGDVLTPETLLLPLTGALQGEEALLRAGRWQGLQYAAPLCWSAWVLAIDSSYDDAPAATPAPTPDALPSATPGFPLAKASKAATPLLAPRGAGMFTLRRLTGDAALPMPDEGLSAAGVYEAFLARKAASALLTTGQATALMSLQAAGRGFPCRMLTPDEIITDQVWMAGVASHSPAAAALVAHLTGEAAQRQLATQGLYPVQQSLPLYAEGFAAQVEAAARRSLTAVNAFLPAEEVARAAWQAYTGAMPPEAALPPLL